MRQTWVLNAALAAAAIAAVAFGVRVQAATVNVFDEADFMRVLAVLGIVALFVERAIEVSIGVWRGATAERLRVAADSARMALARDSSNFALRDLAVEAEREHAGFKDETKTIAMRAAVVLGIVAAAAGASALSPLLIPEEGRAAMLFRLFDLLLTGAAIGGGSEPIHKMMSVITTYMETARSHAEVSRPAVPPPAPGAPVI